MPKHKASVIGGPLVWEWSCPDDLFAPDRLGVAELVGSDYTALSLSLGLASVLVTPCNKAGILVQQSYESNKQSVGILFWP